MRRLGLIGAAVLLYLGAQCAVGMADSAGSATGGAAELARLNAQILQQPNNTALNLRYAALAEQLGKPRLALAAYERILVYDPQNNDALTGVARIRKQLQPATTKFVLGLSGGYESNPLYLPSTPLVKSEGEFSGYLNMRDERQIADYSWRTLGGVDGIVHGEFVALDYAHAGVMTGPVLALLPNLQVHTAIGGAGAYFDTHPYYGEVAASATFETYPAGAYEAVMFKAALRDYDSFFVPDHGGGYAEVVGKFTIPAAVPDFAFLFTPWIRFSEIHGALGSPPPNPLLEPGDYIDTGAKIEADYSPVNWIVLGANFALGERYYRDLPQTVLVVPERDTTWSPGGMVLFPHVFDYQTDLRFDYKYIQNYSNNPGFVFVDRVATGTVVRRF